MEKIDIYVNERGRILGLLMDAWKTYLTWYTFFFTANMVSIGWLLTSEHMTDAIFSDTNGAHLPSVMLSGIWVALDIAGPIACVFMLNYTRSCKANLSELESSVAGLLGNKGSAAKASPFPFSVTIYGAYANALSLILVLGFWIYFLIAALG